MLYFAFRLLRVTVHGVEQGADRGMVVRLAQVASLLWCQGGDKIPGQLTLSTVCQRDCLFEALEVVALVVLERLLKAFRLPERTAEPGLRLVVKWVELQCEPVLRYGAVMQSRVGQFRGEPEVSIAKVRVQCNGLLICRDSIDDVEIAHMVVVKVRANNIGVPEVGIE